MMMILIGDMTIATTEAISNNNNNDNVTIISISTMLLLLKLSDVFGGWPISWWGS